MKKLFTHHASRITPARILCCAAVCLLAIALMGAALKVSEMTLVTAPGDTNRVVLSATNGAGGTNYQVSLGDLATNVFNRPGLNAATQALHDVKQPGSLNLTNWSLIPTGSMANVVAADWLTNWAASISNLAETKQLGSANLTNWSLIPTGSMANVVAADFLTNWAGAVSNLAATKQNGSTTLTNLANGTLNANTGSVGRLEITNGTSTSAGRVGGTIFGQTNGVGLTNKGFTCLLDGIGTTNFPANFFEVGRPVTLDLEGAHLATAGTFWTNQVRLGGSMVASNLTQNNTWDTETRWTCRVRLTPISIGASGSIRVSGWFDGVSSDSSGPFLGFAGYPWLPYSTVVAVDTTAAIAFGIHSASSTADAGTAYIRVTGGTIRVD